MVSRQPSGSVVLECRTARIDTVVVGEHLPAAVDHTLAALVNGYSGLVPERYVQLIDQLPRFPERDVVDALRAINVKFILINRARYAGGF